MALLATATTQAASDAESCAAALGQPLVGEQVLLKSPLRVLSWNIQKAGDTDWAGDLRQLSGIIQLAFIQEAAVKANIAGEIPLPLYQAFAAGYTTDDIETGVLTLSTSSPSLLCNLTAWEPWLGTPKATSVTEHPMAGHENRLLAINIHAVNFELSAQEFEAQLNSIATVIAAHTGPVIAAGDFNTWSEDRQDMVDALMAEHGLINTTYEPDLRTRFLDWPLDHIYLHGLSVQDTEVTAVDSSDHNPLSATLTWP